MFEHIKRQMFSINFINSKCLIEEIIHMITKMIKTLTAWEKIFS